MCRRAIENAKASIDLNETQDHTDASAALQGLNEKDKDKGITALDKTAEEEDISKKEATGGKRAWKTIGADEDPGSDTRAQSLEIFRKHKREGTLLVPECTLLQTKLSLHSLFLVLLFSFTPPLILILHSLSYSFSFSPLLPLTLNAFAELRQELVIVAAFMDKMILANEAKNKEKARAKELIIKAERLSKLKAEGKVKDDGTDGALTVAKTDKEEVISKKRKGGSEAVDSAVEDSKLLYLLPFYSRLFSFVMPPKQQNNVIIVNTDLPESSTTDNSNTDSKSVAVNELSTALLSKFGLNVCLEKLELGYVAPVEDPEIALKKIKENEKKKAPKPDNRREKNLERKLKKKGLTNNNDAKPKVGSGNELKFKEIFSMNILPDGFINFGEVFRKKAFVTPTADLEEEKTEEVKSDVKLKKGKKSADSSKKASEAISSRPLKMEICSGAGEWAVSQVRSCMPPAFLFVFISFSLPPSLLPYNFRVFCTSHISSTHREPHASVITLNITCLSLPLHRPLLIKTATG